MNFWGDRGIGLLGRIYGLVTGEDRVICRRVWLRGNDFTLEQVGVHDKEEDLVNVERWFYAVVEENTRDVELWE